MFYILLIFIVDLWSVNKISYQCCVCCQIEVSVKSWLHVQGNPTDCGESLCVTSKPQE